MRSLSLLILLACRTAGPPPAAAYAPRPIPPTIVNLRVTVQDPEMQPATDESLCSDLGQLKVGPTIRTRLRGLTEERVRQSGAQLAAAKDAHALVALHATPRSKTGFAYCTPASTTQVVVRSQSGTTLTKFVVDIPQHDANIGDDNAVLGHVALIAEQVANGVLSDSAVAAVAKNSGPVVAGGTSHGAVKNAATMLVLDLARAGSVAPHVPGLLTRLLLAELEKVKNLKTVSSQDIESLLNVERKKDLVGCNTTSCMAEIGGALGAQLVLYGELGQLGSRFNVNLTVVNSRTAKVAGRVSILVEAKEDALADQAPELARQVVAKLNADD